MKVIKAMARQTIIDIAIQEFGSAEAAFEILKDNPALEGITIDLPEGTLLNIAAASDNANSAVRDYLSSEKIATGSYVAPDPLTPQRNFGADYDPTKFS